MKYIVFDCAASITTDKNFEDLTVAELVAAMRARLDRIEELGDVEAFGNMDELDY